MIASVDSPSPSVVLSTALLGCVDDDVAVSKEVLATEDCSVVDEEVRIVDSEIRPHMVIKKMRLKRGNHRRAGVHVDYLRRRLVDVVQKNRK